MRSKPVDEDEFFEIRVRDHLDAGWFRMFPDLSVKNMENGEVLITGRLAGQAALYRVLERIRNLNLTLISVRRMEGREGN